MAKVTAKQLASDAGLDLAHALYRKAGDWYHVLRGFPGALFDDNGYIRFETEADYKAFVRSGKVEGINENRETNTLVVKGGIGRHRNYTLFTKATLFPNEITAEKGVIEGAKLRVTVNRYERSPHARQLCLRKWGSSCVVCQTDFGRVYGEIGDGFIHVHHLVPLSTIRRAYRLNPERDLRPVCPNCHAMLHRREPPYSVDELRKMIRKAV